MKKDETDGRFFGISSILTEKETWIRIVWQNKKENGILLQILVKQKVDEITH
jgi:hypothetical protein